MVSGTCGHYKCQCRSIAVYVLIYCNREARCVRKDAQSTRDINRSTYSLYAYAELLAPAPT